MVVGGAAVAGDSVGLHKQPPAGRQQAPEGAQQAERVLDAVQDPEAEDHVEALTGVHERERVAAHVLHARAQELGDRAEALAAFELDPPACLDPGDVLLVVDRHDPRRAAISARKA